MNTRIVFTRNSPLRTALVNETTGQELYRIETPRKFVGSVTRVFRSDPTAPNLIPRLHLDTNEPYENYDSEERELLTGVGCGQGDGGVNDSEVGDVVDETPGDDLPLVESEIARLYWKWFASTRIVFEGKIRRRAEFMPLRGKLRAWVFGLIPGTFLTLVRVANARRNYVFNHNRVSYCWSLSAFRGPRVSRYTQRSLLSMKLRSLRET